MKYPSFVVAPLFVLAVLCPSATSQSPFWTRTSAIPSPISTQQANQVGPGHPWQAQIPGVNLFSRAKATRLSLLQFQARGGLPVSFSLHHDSKAVFHDPALGSKWSHSFDTHLDTWSESGVRAAALVWGNHQVQLFQKVGSLWVPLDGYRDQLAEVGTSYALTLHDQTRLEFERAFFAGKIRHRLSRIADPNGNAIVLAYTGGRLAQVIDPSGREIELTYDAAARLAAVHFKVAGMVRTWTIQRDAGNRIASVHWPTVTTSGGPSLFDVSVSLNPDDNIELLTDRTGRSWQTSYDTGVDADAVLALLAPGSSQAVYVTAPTSTSVRVEDELGVATTYSYDGLSRLIARALSTKTIAYAYLDPDFAWAPSRITAGSGTQWQLDYDATGNVVGAIDPALQRWDCAYDAHNNLVQVLEPLVTDAWGTTELARHRTDYAYDGADNLVQVDEYVDPFNFVSTSRAHDPFGQPVVVTDPSGNSIQLSYDVFGNLAQLSTSALRTRQWLYEDPFSTLGFTVPNAVVDGAGQRGDLYRDEWGRLVSEGFPDASGAEYTYDAENRLVRMLDPSGTTDWSYTPRGLVQDELRGGTMVHLDYLDNGLRSHLFESGPSGTRDLDYSYTPRNELSLLTDGSLVTSFLYDIDGRLTRRTLPSNARMERSYIQGRLSSVRHFSSSGSLLASYNYVYQQNALVKSVGEPGGNVTRYGYDFQDRLVRELRTGSLPFDFTWAYDSAGRRVQQTRNLQITFFTHDLDGLVVQSVTGGNPPDSYTWDQDARMVFRSRQGLEHQFAYDFSGRVTEISRFDSGSGWLPAHEFHYDGLDRRVARTVFDALGLPQLSSTYTHDGASVLREERQDWIAGPGRFQATWAFGLVAWRDAISGQEQWPSTDGFGSLRGCTDGWGQPQTYSGLFNAFGEAIHDSGLRPPFAFLADSGSLSDVDGEGLLDGGELFDPQVAQNFSGAQWIASGCTSGSPVPHAFQDGTPVPPSGQEEWPAPPTTPEPPFRPGGPDCIGTGFEHKPWATPPPQEPTRPPKYIYLGGSVVFGSGVLCIAPPLWRRPPTCYLPEPHDERWRRRMAAMEGRLERLQR